MTSTPFWETSLSSRAWPTHGRTRGMSQPESPEYASWDQGYEDDNEADALALLMPRLGQALGA